ncbi:MAG: DNA (cytosine-5-)-methyltransferase, partial [Rubrobacteraceae bacterium]
MTVEQGGTFTFVDLFAGIGGFHAAFAKLGGQCVYASEKDKAAAGVYRKAWPTDDEDGFEFTADITDDVDRIGDLTTLDDLAKMAAAGRGTISNKIPQNFDVLAAGFPCQAFSKSGHQKGVLDETRGTLFYNILRIVAERKPKIVFLENVRNLVGQRHRQTTFVTIVKALQSLGYVVSDVPTLISPHKIPAYMGGGPQNRERVYILAIRADLLTNDDAPEPFSEFHYPRSWDPKKAWSLTQTELTDGVPAAITDEWLSANGDTVRIERLRDLRALTQQHSVADAEWLAPWEALLAEVVRRRKLTSGAGRAPFPGYPIWLAAADPEWENGARRTAD